MSNYREIVTKAVVSKGKKSFTTTKKVKAINPSTVLGCWVINHKFNGTKSNDKIVIDGSYDINIWYSSNNDTKTEVIKETNTYHEVVKMRERENISNEEVMVRSLKQPNCTNIEIVGDEIEYTIEKELGIELIGDIKVKVEANLEEDPYDDIVEETTIEKEIEEEVKEDYLEEETI